MKYRWVMVLLASSLVAMLAVWSVQQLLGGIPGLLWLTADVWMWAFWLLGSLMLLALYVPAGMIAARFRFAGHERLCLLAGLPLLIILSSLLGGKWPAYPDVALLLQALLMGGAGMMSGAWLAGKSCRQAC